MHDEHERDGGHATSLPIGTTESLSLPVLQAGGFGASVDAFAWEPDSDANPPRMRLWLVSLLGSQQAVKALWAQLIQGETATLSNDHGSSRFCVLAPEGARGWRCFRASLPASGGYHGLLVPELALFTAEHTDFLLLRRPDDDVATLHYRFLNRRVILPLHPSWADWLWNRALRSGEARTLESRGLDAYRCVPDEAALAADLAADIRRGVLSITDENVGHAQPRIPIETIVEKIGHGAT
ncbi:MAG: hypothetical protein IT305_10115 [Chloroflexi bacterium]|nr:hypothetical protein [Chloroflexota bacterium]